MDSNLCMNTNFDCAYKKASGRLRLLQNVRKYLTVDAALKIFRMIILPILTYGTIIKMTFTETQKEKLNSLQNRAKSIICSKDVPNIIDVIKRKIMYASESVWNSKFKIQLLKSIFH